MNEQAMQDMITNATAELNEAISNGDEQVVMECESYLDDLYNEQNAIAV